MSGAVVRKLFESLDELERSIGSAKRSLGKRDPIPLELLRRVTDYENILKKQRKLAQELCKHVVAENWAEVARHTRLINAFSAMIYNDALELTKGIIDSEQREALKLPEDIVLS